MRLWLTPEQAQAILQHAKHELPREACGLLFGTSEKVQQIVPIPNDASDPLHHYHMEEQAFTEAMFRYSKANLSLVGSYHSHPNTHPIPSSTDIQQANYPDTPYLIVGVHGHEAELAAWSILYDRVERVDLFISIQPPPNASEPLSKAQKTAIILSAVLVFIFMIVVSLSLLPPAPIIVSPLAK